MLTPDKREALQKARRLIERGYEKYIRWSLQNVARTHPKLEAACEELEEYVALTFGGRDSHGFSPSLEEWQRDNGFGYFKRDGRQDRLDWIDWMLLCLEGYEPFISGSPQPVGNRVIVRVKLRNGSERERAAEWIRWFAWREHGLSKDQTPEDVEKGHQCDVVGYKVAT